MKKSYARLLKAAYEQDLETFEKLLPAFKCTSNARIDNLLNKIFHTEDDMYVDFIPAEKTLSMLRMLVAEDIILRDGQQLDPRSHPIAENRYLLGISVTSVWILHECGYKYHYTPEECKDIAILLWIIGGGLTSPFDFLYDLWGVAVDEWVEPLIQFCLCLPMISFETLDTANNSALLRVLIAHEDDNWEVCEKAVRFALDNGADINHRLSNGFSVLDAVAHNCRCPAFAYDLLVSLGAKQEGA